MGIPMVRPNGIPALMTATATALLVLMAPAGAQQAPTTGSPEASRPQSAAAPSPLEERAGAYRLGVMDKLRIRVATSAVVFPAASRSPMNGMEREPAGPIV